MLDVVGEGVQAFWQDGMLLDYTIEVQDERIKVHKVIMASVSDYFKVMLTGEMLESKTDRVRLEGQNAQAVSAMVEFIYTGQLGTTAASTEELLACAMYLQIQPAIDACCEQLSEKVDAKNCIDILATFRAYSLQDGIDQTVSYIRSNMDEILKGFELDEMSQDKLKIVLDCWGKSEWKLFLTIKDWIEFDSENRKEYLNNLMSLVHFALMTPEQLEAVKAMDIYSESDGSWCNLVVEGQKYHNLPIHLKVLDVSEQSKVRTDPVPLCFVEEENSEGDFYAVKGTNWIREKAINQTEFCFGECALIKVNNFLIACNINEFNVFDPRTKQWSLLTTIPVPKLRFHPVYHDKRLYILGGHLRQYGQVYVASDSIERYDFETNSWSVLPTKMPVFLKDFNACILDGSIYVIYRDTEKICEDNSGFIIRMDCFDPATNTWTKKAPMTEFITDYTIDVIELWKEKVIMIMTHGFFMKYYHPSTNQWCAYDPLKDATTRMVYDYRGSVLPSGNRLFLVNFRYSDYEHVPSHTRLNIGDTPTGRCEVWTMREKAKKPFMKELDDFPIDEYDEDYNLIDYSMTSLALAPQ